MNILNIFGERSLTLIGAVFPDFASADAARRDLGREAALEGEISLVGPDDPLTAMKLEPEQKGIWWTMIRSHVVLGGAGLLLGVVVALLLAAAGWPPAAASPGYAALFLGVMGGFVGMIGAGLITLRPDHGLVIRQLRDALARRRWALVVRPVSSAHAELAMARLRAAGAKPLRSF